MRDAFSLLDALESDLSSLGGAAVDAKYKELAAQAVGAEVASAIAALPTDADREALRAVLLDALERAHRAGAAVVNVEYDLAQQWAVWLFVCHEYAAVEEGDESWAQEYAEELRGPTLDDFANLHQAHGAFADSPRLPATLYLIARLSVTLQELASSAPYPRIGICLGYHQQDPIWRLREPQL
jgi:hypothetical protein